MFTRRLHPFPLLVVLVLCAALPQGAGAQESGSPVGPGEPGSAPGGSRPLLEYLLPGRAQPQPDAPVSEPVEPPAGQTQTPIALPELDLPELNSYAPVQPSRTPLAVGDGGEITLTAKLTEEGAEIPRGLVWRVFRPEPGEDGKLPLVASAQGGSSSFVLEPGSYLVHAAYGRAGATKRINVTRDPRRENLVLDAGGLKLDAVLSGGVRIPSDRLRFSIFDESPDVSGERGLIMPDVSPGTVVRLNAGTYHVVSNYGSVNAVIRADIRVESGQLTEATVEHKAAQLTMKLVREAGGEAIADTSWSILTGSGDVVQESVGAFASMVLAEGNYTAVAKNRDRIYSRDFTVVAGRNQDVEVMAVDGQPASTGGAGSGDG